LFSKRTSFEEIIERSGKMKIKRKGLTVLLVFFILLISQRGFADVFFQCPSTVVDVVSGQTADPDVRCKHVVAGDGFSKMADGRDQYIFGFGDATGISDDQVLTQKMLKMEQPGPTLVVQEGQDFYVSLTNVGLIMRPDLFDPHTIHWHGFPNAASIFDGVPEPSMAINIGATFTYYYRAAEPGTYMYHCHVEATEHMQMGMLANLWVLPAQDSLPDLFDLNGFTHHTGYKYAYNDGDGSTYYDLDYPVQITSFDPEFHDANLAIQPLPFANMYDKYPLLNGRGYPDTINPNPITNQNGFDAQKVPTRITASVGQKILLRFSSLSTTDSYTLTALGLPMKVVGKDARILRSPTSGENIYYDTNSVTLGGGEAYDVIIDTTGVPAGTYFLYTTNLNYLSNNTQDLGGMMTEIVVN
jgi:FtsP/CotA-like multicopper oxidase with cupredoxin domain